MLEEIVLSITTAIFFLCTAVVSSVLPTDAEDISAPTAVVSDQEIFEADSVAVSGAPTAFDLIGEWKSAGHTLIFKSPDRLILDGQTMSFSVDGNVITVTAELGGVLRVSELSFVPLGDRLMKLNGITAYKIG